MLKFSRSGKLWSKTLPNPLLDALKAYENRAQKVGDAFDMTVSVEEIQQKYR